MALVLWSLFFFFFCLFSGWMVRFQIQSNAMPICGWFVKCSTHVDYDYWKWIIAVIMNIHCTECGKVYNTIFTALKLYTVERKCAPNRFWCPNRFGAINIFASIVAREYLYLCKVKFLNVYFFYCLSLSVVCQRGGLVVISLKWIGHWVFLIYNSCLVECDNVL